MSGNITLAALVAAVFSASACGDSANGQPDAGRTDAAPHGDAEVDAAPQGDVIFPEDFEDSYVEMRDCRHSHEHELRYIRVLASPTAQAPYGALSPDEPYPVGATLVKIEHDDEDCQVRLGFTAMQKLETGSSLEGGDWRWQRVSIDRDVLEDGAPSRCITCHANHCAPPLGFDLTCAEEEF